MKSCNEDHDAPKPNAPPQLPLQSYKKSKYRDAVQQRQGHIHLSKMIEKQNNWQAEGHPSQHDPSTWTHLLGNSYVAFDVVDYGQLMTAFAVLIPS
jgi:hypothetical protein